MTDRDRRIDALWKQRQRSRLLRLGSLVMLGLIVYAWGWGDLELDRFFSQRSNSNLERFLGEIRPYPLWDKEWDWGVAWSWARESLHGKGGEAVLATVALSVAAICLAGLLGLLASLLAARNIATPEPFLPAARPPPTVQRVAWKAVVVVTRFALIFLRAIPEYVWAFLLVVLLGPEAWPAVLALGLHNAGILGKLYAEVAENADPHAPRALRAAGASRRQIAATCLVPEGMNRFLLYFFYRWETCVREATVLGLLGFVSLGWYIQQARAGVRYDEMVLFVLLGSAIILAGDIVSAVARGIIRRAS
ncbi:MAG: PhnE/PtxC family ABC transporter permease [Planctomycetota bacterium]|jgi:phosphonate transport system permease protein